MDARRYLANYRYVILDIHNLVYFPPVRREGDLASLSVYDATYARWSSGHWLLESEKLSIGDLPSLTLPFTFVKLIGFIHFWSGGLKQRYSRKPYTVGSLFLQGGNPAEWVCHAYLKTILLIGESWALPFYSNIHFLPKRVSANRPSNRQYQNASAKPALWG